MTKTIWCFIGYVCCSEYRHNCFLAVKSFTQILYFFCVYMCFFICLLAIPEQHYDQFERI